MLQMNGQSLAGDAGLLSNDARQRARARLWQDRIGSIEAGREADLVVLDSRATPAMAHRMETARGRLGGGAVRADDDGRRSGGGGRPMWRGEG